MFYSSFLRFLHDYNISHPGSLVMLKLCLFFPWPSEHSGGSRLLLFLQTLNIFQESANSQSVQGVIALVNLRLPHCPYPFSVISPP